MNLAKTASESHSEFIFEEVVKIKDQICQGELVYSMEIKDSDLLYEHHLL